MTWPLTAYAQQTAKVPRIGYLPLKPVPRGEDEAFKQGLHDLGWIEGQTIAIEYRWVAGQVARLPALAVELVRLQVDPRHDLHASEPGGQGRDAVDSYRHGHQYRSGKNGPGGQPRTAGWQHYRDERHRSGAGGQAPGAAQHPFAAPLPRGLPGLWNDPAHRLSSRKRRTPPRDSAYRCSHWCSAVSRRLTGPLRPRVVSRRRR